MKVRHRHSWGGAFSQIKTRGGAEDTGAGPRGGAVHAPPANFSESPNLHPPFSASRPDPGLWSKPISLHLQWMVQRAWRGHQGIGEPWLPFPGGPSMHFSNNSGATLHDWGQWLSEGHSSHSPPPPFNVNNSWQGELAPPCPLFHCLCYSL